MKRTDKDQPLAEQPKGGQIWRTNKGHRVKIFTSYMPGPATCIESVYVQDQGAVECRVNGRLGINFDLQGNAISSDDFLTEREA